MNLILLWAMMASPKPAPGYTVEIESSRTFGKTVVVCSILAPGVVVGGGDNCDFHSHPDPVYCLFLPGNNGCGQHPEKLPNQCGTSFGCQNLDAFPPEQNKEAR